MLYKRTLHSPTDGDAFVFLMRPTYFWQRDEETTLLVLTRMVAMTLGQETCGFQMLKNSDPETICLSSSEIITSRILMPEIPFRSSYIYVEQTMSLKYNGLDVAIEYTNAQV